MTSSPRPSHELPAASPLPAPDGGKGGPGPRLKTLLDWFLSEHLRQAPPYELHRHRVFIGASLFALVFTLWYLAFAPAKLDTIPSWLQCGYYAFTLRYARTARSLAVPTLILCVSMTMAYVVSVFMTPQPWAGAHATTMLIPAFVVFMLGPRQGLVLTVVFAACVGILRPLYQLHVLPPSGPVTRQDLMIMYITAATSLLGAWWLSSLHSTSRDAAHQELERALSTLRESEDKLSSLVESTDDLVFSLDTDQRVITANAAMRRRYQEIHQRELVTGRKLRPPSPDAGPRWLTRFDYALAGQHLRFEEEYRQGEHCIVMDVSISPIRGARGGVKGVTVFARDITARKLAETRLGEMHRSLMEVSRYAGMAEVATGVLHNVGNTLNSVNTSVGLLDGQLRHSRVSGLRKAATLLREHEPDLGAFLSVDPRGQQLSRYLLTLSGELEKERDTLRQEVGALAESVEHIKSIVSMQQQHARAIGVVERLPVPRLIEEALRLHATAFERQGIHIEREYAEVPSILVDRHNLLQILANLLSNARDSLLESTAVDKRLRIRVRLEEGDTLGIDITDNGVGIPSEHLVRVFSQGFTTKRQGHGFGLHISALAAKDLRGRLTCTSGGPGQGATFSLVLPVTGPHELPAPPASA